MPGVEPPAGGVATGNVYRSIRWLTISIRRALDVLSVHEAIDRLSLLNMRQGQAMTLRYFGGLTVEEIASALEVSVATVERDCRLARAWLHGQLRDGRSE